MAWSSICHSSEENFASAISVNKVLFIREKSIFTNHSTEGFFEIETSAFKTEK